VAGLAVVGLLQKMKGSLTTASQTKITRTITMAPVPITLGPVLVTLSSGHKTTFIPIGFFIASPFLLPQDKD